MHTNHLAETQTSHAMQVDTLMMKHFLSGFGDDDAKLILKHCAEVIPSHADILLLQVFFLCIAQFSYELLIISNCQECICGFLDLDQQYQCARLLILT